MDRRARNVLLVVLVAAVALGVGGAGWWILRGDRPAQRSVELQAPIDLPEPAAPAPVDEGQRTVELADEPAPTFGSLDTTVVYPLEVLMKLVRASATPKADDAPELGTGASSKLVGSVTNGKQGGVRVQARFVAGSNKGRTLYADALGRFGAEGLYPGLSVVAITGPGIAGCEREVRLRPGRETSLNVDFGRPSRVVTEVIDKEAKPIAGALVSLDGQTVETPEDGVAEFSGVAAGEVLVVVTKPGFASLRQSVVVVAGSTIERGKLRFRIDPGASLQVSITDALNSEQEALLFLLPDAADAERKFPWQNVNPVRIWPGGSKVIEDLPEARISVRLYHAGATAKPPMQSVELHPGARASLSFGLAPAPVVVGVVTDQGAPAQNAIVRLEAPDRTAAMLSVFDQQSFLFLESDVLPDLPPAMQEATTNAKGEFQLSASEDVAPVRYLTALSRDGQRVAHAVLHKGDARADLVLAPVVGGEGELAIQMSDRIQPLPVEVTVDGVPRDPFTLPLGRDLRVADLPEGSWLVTVRWNGETLTKDQPLEIRGETRLSVALPEGAIVGQDAETRLRAGKH